MTQDKKISLDDVLNDKATETQTFKKAEKKAQLLKKAQAKIKSVGRPPVKEKAKQRILYYSDEEYAVIKKIASLYAISPTKWIKMIINKELRKEGIIS